MIFVLVKSNVITLELLLYRKYIYFVSIDAWVQVAILLACGPGVVVVNCWDKFCILGRAPRIKETLLDFHEWCRVTRHPRIFRGLTGCQRNPRFWGITGCSLFGRDHEPVWLQFLKIVFYFEKQGRTKKTGLILMYDFLNVLKDK